MTKDEAILELIRIAKESISVVDGEWGCCHNYNEALTLRTDADPAYGEVSKKITDCRMHDEAVHVAALIAVVTGEGGN